MTSKPTGKKIKSGRLAFRIAILLLLSLFLGASVYSLNARRVFHNAMPMPFGVGSSIVLSGSMEPTLSVNDLVFVAAKESYELGDIIVYQSGSSLVIHRIVGIREDGYVTKGDANNTEDGLIAPDAVKGRMVFRVPYVGLAVQFFQSLPGAALLIALAVLLVNASWSKERAEDSRDLDRLKEEIRALKEKEEAAEKSSENQPDQPAKQ